MKTMFKKPVGERMFSTHALWVLLVPLLIEQLLVMSVGMFDTMMVASLGEGAVSSVSLVDSVNILLVQIFAALSTGGAVVTSQYIGRRDFRMAKASAGQLISSILALATLVAVFTCLFHAEILKLVFGGLDDEIMGYAKTYFFLSALSYPFLGLYNGLAALFRAQGNSKVSMIASFCMNIINVAGNALFIFVFHLGVLGAALATLIARICAAIFVLVLLQKEGNPLRIDSWHALLPDFALIKRILSIGIPSGIENGMFQFGKLAVSGLVSTLSTAAIAANAVTGTLVNILSIPGNAIGIALITVVGQCIGAGEKEQAKYYSMRLLGIAFLCTICTNSLSLLFMSPMLALFHLSPEAMVIGKQILVMFNLCAMVLFVPSFALSSSLRSAGDAKYTMYVSAFSMWTFRVISSYILVCVFHLGVIGVWMGMFLDWGCRSVFYIARYCSGKWLDKKVI